MVLPFTIGQVNISAGSTYEDAGQPNGIAALDANGHIIATQIPGGLISGSGGANVQINGSPVSANTINFGSGLTTLVTGSTATVTANTIGFTVNGTSAPTSTVNFGAGLTGVVTGNILTVTALTAATSGAITHELFGSGNNTYGQLGIGSTINATAFASMITPNSSYKDIGGCSGAFYAIKQDGTLWGVGYDINGQLGGTGNKSSLVQLSASTNWTRIKGGGASPKFMNTAGELWGIGTDAYGLLGNGSGSASSSLVQFGANSNWIDGGSGNTYALAVASDGTLWAAGENYWGDFGNGASTGNASYPSPVQTNTSTWASVSAGYAGTCFAGGIQTNGTLWMWGSNGGAYGVPAGLLGTNNTIGYSSPVQIGTSTWKHLSCGYNHSLAIDSAGTLWAWGSGVHGELGNGSITGTSSPVAIASTLSWADISAGYYISAGIKSDGTLWTWGDNSQGALGLTSTGLVSSPVQIGTSTSWKKVSASSYNGETIYAEQNQHLSMFVAGSNTNNALGNPGPVTQLTPIQLQNSNTWSSISVGNLYGMAVDSSGALWGWGTGTSGQLGNGSNVVESSPVQVGTLTQWSQVSCGYATVSAIKRDGSLWGWGASPNGQLPNGGVGTNSPVQIGALTTWKQSSQGANHGAAVTTDLSLWAWGLNNYGQLGQSNTINYSSPVQLGIGSLWQKVDAGGSTTIAIKTDGTLWGCGYNQTYMLAQTTNTPVSSLVQVSTGNWVDVACGYNHVAAIKADGTLWAWGFNNYGQLGLGNTTTYTSPVQIGALTNWVQVVACNDSTVAIKQDGTAWAWGYNAQGQLGLGDLISRSSPVQIGSLTNWTAASISGGGTLGLLAIPGTGAVSSGITNLYLETMGNAISSNVNTINFGPGISTSVTGNVAMIEATPIIATGAGVIERYEFTSSTTWVVPIGLTEISVTACAGGGGGGGYTATTGAGGGGGGGGFVYNYPLTVAPGHTLSITIGAAGAAGTTGSGASGTSTIITDTTTSTVLLTLTGGSGGTWTTSGGTASGSAGAPNGLMGGYGYADLGANFDYGGYGGASLFGVTSPSTTIGGTVAGNTLYGGGGGGGCNTVGSPGSPGYCLFEAVNQVPALPVLSRIPGLTVGAAYSLRQLTSTYTGNCIQVRRDSDNTISNIGFVGGVIDTAGLIAFTGTANGFVTAWYDQSGNGITVSQATSTAQPQIVANGAVITSLGSPTVTFNGSMQLQSAAQSILSSGASESAMLAVGSYIGGGASPAIAGYGSNASNSNRSIFVNSSNYWSVGVLNSLYQSMAYAMPSAFSFNVVPYLNTYDMLYTNINGSYAGCGAVGILTTPTTSNVYVGGSVFGSDWYGTCSEVIFLNGAVKNSTLIEIQNDQVTFFNI